MIAALLATGADLQTPAQQHTAGRELLSRSLEDTYGLPAHEATVVPDHRGKPVLAHHPEIHVSISHCAGAVAVAVSDAPVGIDVERIRPWDRFAARRMLHPTEIGRVEQASDPDREFFRYWTAKESYVKATGVGLTYPVRTLVLTVTADGGAQLNRPRATLSLNEECDGYVIATCSLRGGPGDKDPALRHVGLRE